MKQNFDVLEGQLGFNNPQIETNRFSLRKELFRIVIPQNAANLPQAQGEANSRWTQELAAHRIANLWDLPEFRQYARPFAEEGTPQPAMVIPFNTQVISGLNFFGQPLSAGDSSYSPSNFATKIRSVGVWFTGYRALGLTETPRVYLIPAGEDVLRAPASRTMEIRLWKVFDQRLPLPYPISDLSFNSSWIPMQDTLSSPFGEIRRHSSFRAYEDQGFLNTQEMTLDSRLIGRSVWNTHWLLIIPGATLHGNPNEGLDTFIYGPKLINNPSQRTKQGISDIKLFFQTYAYSGV